MDQDLSEDHLRVRELSLFNIIIIIIIIIVVIIIIIIIIIIVADITPALIGELLLFNKRRVLTIFLCSMYIHFDNDHKIAKQ